MLKVVHMTSAHAARDVRILLKECVGAAKSGIATSLVAAGSIDFNEQGVDVIVVPMASSRFLRMTKTAYQVFRRAYALNADVYHFHDPELIPWALLLRLLGKQVIYDIHEDYVSSIAQKRYIPGSLRQPLSFVWDFFERIVAKAFDVVIAETYYQRRFPSGHTVLNYPNISTTYSYDAHNPNSRSLLYTGNISQDRGALLHANICTYGMNLDVHLFGRCSTQLAEQMRKVAGKDANRLHIRGSAEPLPAEEINAQYSQAKWLAGLAIFPDTPHYREKELTKFFEYMLAGLPIICTDFPRWKELIEGNGVGLCVSPKDSASVKEALAWLTAHPGKAVEMGRRGKQLVREKFNWDSQMANLSDLYYSIRSRKLGRS